MSGINFSDFSDEMLLERIIEMSNSRGRCEIIEILTQHRIKNDPNSFLSKLLEPLEIAFPKYDELMKQAKAVCLGRMKKPWSE